VGLDHGISQREWLTKPTLVTSTWLHEAAGSGIRKGLPPGVEMVEIFVYARMACPWERSQPGDLTGEGKLNPDSAAMAPRQA
jgi:hypothetical protein